MEEPPNDTTMITLPDGKHPIPLHILQSIYHPGKKEVITPTIELPTSGMRILVTGGAGFVGSHLVDRLMLLGHKVTILDDYSTGREDNISHWLSHPNFKMIHHDVQHILPMEGNCCYDRIYHLACPASPPQYQADEVRTVQTCFLGTMNMLKLAQSCNARFLLASTSEVYGDPTIHPQPESYHGNVNCTGIRACYDEGKRCAETLAYCYQRQYNVTVRVARIFNTYGPRMDCDDGRVVSNFITAALKGEPLLIYGDGEQTRSFQFVHDLVSGLIALMEGDYSMPVNLGNPEEYSIQDFAHITFKYVKSDSEIVYKDAIPDDPHQRKPDISVAFKELNWRPEYTLHQGLLETVEYFRRLILLE